VSRCTGASSTRLAERLLKVPPGAMVAASCAPLKPPRVGSHGEVATCSDERMSRGRSTSPTFRPFRVREFCSAPSPKTEGPCGVICTPGTSAASASRLPSLPGATLPGATSARPVSTPSRSPIAWPRGACRRRVGTVRVSSRTRSPLPMAMRTPAASRWPAANVTRVCAAGLPATLTSTWYAPPSPGAFAVKRPAESAVARASARERTCVTRTSAPATPAPAPSTTVPRMTRAASCALSGAASAHRDAQSTAIVELRDTGDPEAGTRRAGRTSVVRCRAVSF
jgi:hypothetical protein